MTELSNALVPYTETRRDQLEKELALVANKREIDSRLSYPYNIIAYYLVDKAVCAIYIEDLSQHTSVEYVVPNNEVYDHFYHALGHPNAVFPKPWDGN